MNREARLQLYNAHVRLAKWVVNRFNLPPNLIEDAEQEALVRLWQLTDIYDPTRGVKFSTYVANSIFNEMRKWLRRCSRTIHIPANIKITDETPACYDVGDATIHTLVGDRSVFDDIRLALEVMCLSARSKEILRLSLLEGMDYRVIAARVGLSKNYTAKVLSESKSRLRGYLGEDFPYEYQVNKIKCFGTYLEKDYDYANR